MYFNYLKISIKFIFIISTCIFSLLSCGLKFGENPPAEDVKAFGTTECLNRSIEEFKRFFEGSSSDVAMDLSLQCVSKVLISFKENINGAQKDKYEASELAYFIEKNFLKEENRFSPEFLSEIMRLKHVLIGGSDKYFLKSDIEKLSQLVERLRPEVVKINPEMKILVKKWSTEKLTTEEKEKVFLASKGKVALFFKYLSSEFAKSGNTYEVSHFFNLLKQFAIFAKG